MKLLRQGLLGLSFGLAACTAPTTLSDDFGNAVRHNKAVHIINPAPAQAVISNMDGPRAAGAIGRYQRGEVVQPRTLSTTSIGTTR